MKVAVLGCGNMAQALIPPIAQSFPEFSFYFYNPSPQKALNLALKTKGEAFRDFEKIPISDVYVLACKPQQFSDLAETLRKNLAEKKIHLNQVTILSLLAGTPVARIQKALGVKKIIRLMPNTPSLVGEGIGLLYFSENFSTIASTLWRNRGPVKY